MVFHKLITLSIQFISAIVYNSFTLYTLNSILCTLYSTLDRPPGLGGNTSNTNTNTNTHNTNTNTNANNNNKHIHDNNNHNNNNTKHTIIMHMVHV